MAELKVGKEYELQITPDDTKQPTLATLRIKADYPQNNPEIPQERYTSVHITLITSRLRSMHR
jgi:hypothetical protein